MWKHIQRLGLASTYAKSVKCQMAFRQVEALAFLSPQEVYQGFAAIRATAPTSMAPFFDYFERTYVLGKIKSNGRRGKPRFPPELWAASYSASSTLPKTSNAVEGWHNKFSGLLSSKTNFKFYEVVRAFQQEENETSGKFLRNLQCDMQQRLNKKQKGKEQKLRTALLRRETEDMTLFEVIQSIALIVQNK